MNVNARISRSNLNLSRKPAPHFYRSYHNLNDTIEQQLPPSLQQQQQLYAYDNQYATKIKTTTNNTPATVETYHTQLWRNNNKINNNNYTNNININIKRNSCNNNNNNNNNWLALSNYDNNAYQTPNFIPASVWMGGEERFVSTTKPIHETYQQNIPNIIKKYNKNNDDNNNNKTNNAGIDNFWQQEPQQQFYQKPLQHVECNPNIKHSKSNHNNKIDHNNQTTNQYQQQQQQQQQQQPLLNVKIRTNAQGLPYTPPLTVRRNNNINHHHHNNNNNNTTNTAKQRAIQAVIPLNDTLVNRRHENQTS